MTEITLNDYGDGKLCPKVVKVNSKLFVKEGNRDLPWPYISSALHAEAERRAVAALVAGFNKGRLGGAQNAPEGGRMSHAKKLLVLG